MVLFLSSKDDPRRSLGYLYSHYVVAVLRYSSVKYTEWLTQHFTAMDNNLILAIPVLYASRLFQNFDESHDRL
jgi:hypothetical protein